MSRAFERFNAEHPGRDANVRGLRMRVVDEGQGDPVVMLHGNPSWSFYYRNLIEALRDTHRVIVPDHIGCGRSEKPNDERYEYTLDSRVEDLESLLDMLGIERDITLIVHDWGGMIGMAYATRHPDRIARLVVLNTAGFRLPASKPLPKSLWLCRNTAMGAFLVRGLNAFARGAAWTCCTSHPMSRDVRNAYCAPYDSWRNRVAVLRFVQDIPLQPGDRAYATVVETEENLARLNGVPMLVAWGMKDFVFDHHFLDEWVRRFPGAEVHRFPKAGHYILEDEAGQVVPLIGEFLAAHPAVRGAR